MSLRTTIIVAAMAAVALLALTAHADNENADAAGAMQAKTKMEDKVMKSDEEWRKELTPEEYRVLREKGTERAFTGEYWDEKTKGVYRCAACGNPLFSSADKFKSGTGWPSYTRPIDDTAVTLEEDNSLFMTRTEVLCHRCGSHLGHVFDDGPAPTGKRYCINSISLDLDPAADADTEMESE